MWYIWPNQLSYAFIVSDWIGNKKFCKFVSRLPKIMSVVINFAVKSLYFVYTVFVEMMKSQNLVKKSMPVGWNQTEFYIELMPDDKHELCKDRWIWWKKGYKTDRVDEDEMDRALQLLAKPSAAREPVVHCFPAEDALWNGYVRPRHSVIHGECSLGLAKEKMWLRLFYKMFC